MPVLSKGGHIITHYGVIQHGWGDSFVFTIDTTLGTGDSFTFPLRSGYTYDFDVYWGDGLSSHVSSYNDPNIFHQYAVSGIYQVEISGTCGAWGFSNAGDKLKITSVDNWYNDFKSLAGGFFGCTNLKSIPYAAIPGNLTDTNNSFNATFQGCSNLEIMLHPDMFKSHTNLVRRAFYSTFNGCSKIYGNIPEDLFRYNIKVGFYAFANTFSGCVGLTGSIPSNLFKYNINARDAAFSGTFSVCTGLTGSIPEELFKFNVLAGSFDSVFYLCAGLTGSIPPNLFRYNVNNFSFRSTFGECIGLTGSIPEDIFYYNSLVTTYERTFQGCRNLVLPVRMFNLANLSIVTNFYYFMYTTSSTYSNTGTIEDVWNYSTPTSKQNAFFNQILLTNYPSIPDNWKGL